MYLYLHGFGSSGEGEKAKRFREYFQGEIIVPSLSYVPDLAIDTLKQIIECMLDHTTVTLIGSSLGGYYATYLAEHYGLKAVLINPSITPYETLGKKIGPAYNYYDESRFEWNDRHIAMLKRFDTPQITPLQYLVLLQSGDDLLDYREAQSKFEGGNLIIEEGGSHAYENIESKFEEIEKFAHRSNYL